MKQFFLPRLVLLMSIFSFSFHLSSCGSSGNSGTTADTTTSAVVPADVVVSSPTASTSVSASLGVKTLKAVGDAATEDYDAKKTALQNLISGDNDCAFTLQIPSVSSPSCYGPPVNFNGHLNSSAIDGDTNDDGQADDDGALPSGDTGIWNTTQGVSEACAAAKMNELVQKVSANVDNMINIAAVMACSGKKAGTTLPTIGATVDLASTVESQSTVSGLTVSSATLARKANVDANSDGTTDPVYVSTLGVSMDFGGAIGVRTGTITLKHIPTTSDNSTYKGKLSFSMAKSSEDGGNCAGTAGTESGAVNAGTILYEKTSGTSLTYETNFAEFCGSSTDPFDTDNNIDPSDKVSTSNTDGWGNNWNYGLFALNPSNGTGTFAYAWQAGQGDGNTRVLDVTTSIDSSDNLSGTAYFGFGTDIATAAGRGTITAMICNWAGPGNTHTGLEKAQRQVMSKASGTDTWISSSANITYAPSNSCDAGIGDGFIYEAVNSGTYAAVAGTSGSELNFDNDRETDAAAVTNNLVNLTDVVFTAPTAPTDI
ncbi:MAG: hypothetical protein COX62_02470 [Deltaproteobacteria bacterium CG_4_10_14_0_2_um_filter_43_8]|nr:MAG: hypothetical protein COV43_07035 [Deltaproteobacteria bacterium CG11_big_fil_rev_8_21_14_0_20_42_23]PJA21431.1 MAG: hypothetical protein COX62_02470 [Deltaproteobacteria bacterium CG_4_10_14_0_2_um_filter_43_8]PJC63858.1 MAG: hypothetical protein CO021_07220 [Deltaproteobacteria bacterium CG_4_9_14_0_2_um_filter_42_21]